MSSSPTIHPQYVRASADEVAAGFHEAFAAGLRPQIDDYLDQGVESREQLLIRLVACELELRLSEGLEVSLLDYCVRYPELRANPTDLAKLLLVELRHHVASGQLDVDRYRQSYPGLPIDELVTHAQALQGRIAGYELRRKLGEGGMGTVYLAYQTALDRNVALKIIRRDKLADPSAIEYFRTRFQREALAVAAINHPHVVQIFEAGDQSGHLFIVMELVEGKSLQQRLNDDGVMPPLEAASLLVKLAYAMQEVHDRHIVHRDLKPDNILLTQSGEPKVSDFGLARPLEHAAGQTLAGWFVGTPEYASPEIAGMSGSPPTPAVDIYGLGAILYATLTGRPPFTRDSIDVTLDRVRRESVVPVRQLRSNCPRDLETICLKCLEKEASKRYATASELADDLTRFVEGRPIRARAVGWIEQSWRWCKRNPWLAAAEFIAVALLMLATLISVLRVIDADRNAAIQTELRQRADERTKAAEIANGRLRTVLDSMFSFRALDYMSQQRELTDYQKEFLKSAEQYFVRAADGMTGRESEAYRASSMIRIGLLYLYMDDTNKSVSLFNEAIEVLERLGTVQPLNVSEQESLGLGYLHRAGAVQNAAPNRSLKDLTRAIELFTAVQTEKDDLDVEENLVLAYYRRGYFSARTSKWDQAFSDYQAAEMRIERLKELGDDEATVESLRGTIWALRGELNSHKNNKEAADYDLTRAISTLTLCHKRAPDNPEVLLRLAATHGIYGDILAATNVSSAVSNYRSAAEYRDMLVNLRPAVTLYRQDAVVTYQALALHLADLEQGDEALAALDLADSHLTVLDKNTSSFYIKYLQGVSLVLRGIVRANVVQWWEYFSPTHVPESLEGLDARMCFRTGLNLRNANNHEKAEQAFTQAITQQQKQLESNPSSIQMRTDLANSFYQRAGSRSELDKSQASIEDYSQTIEILQPLVKEGHSVEDQQYTLALAYLERGILQFDPIGDLTSAVQSHLRAIECFRELVEQKPLNRDYKLFLGGSYCNLGQTYRDDTPGNALPQLRQAIFILNDLHQREPEWRKAGVFLRNAHWISGEALDKLGRHDEALKHWDEALALDQDEVRKLLLVQRGSCQLERGQIDLARSDAEAALEYDDLPRYSLRRLAGVFGKLNARKLEQSEQDASACIECLRRAVDRGWKDVEDLSRSLDFETLRDDERFKKLLDQLSN